MLAKKTGPNTYVNCWGLDEATHVWVTGTGLVEITPEIREELLKQCHLSFEYRDTPQPADGPKP